LIYSREFRLVLDDFAAVFHEAARGFLNIFDRHLEDRAQGRAALDEEIDVLAMKADHLRAFGSNHKAELLDVERCRLHWIWRLNEDVGTKAVCHVGSLVRERPLSLSRRLQ
jgi:hypothetical protein